MTSSSPPMPRRQGGLFLGEDVPQSRGASASRALPPLESSASVSDVGPGEHGDSLRVECGTSESSALSSTLSPDPMPAAGTGSSACARSSAAGLGLGFSGTRTSSSSTTLPQLPVRGAMTVASAERPAVEPPRVYQAWPQVGGRNRFVCGGRCMIGPRIDFWYNCCAWSSILIPTSFYFILCSEWLWTNVSPWLPVLTAIIFAATVIFFLLTSCTDPGIIPRSSLQAVVDNLEEEVAAATGASLAIIRENGGRISAEGCELTEEQHALGYRWCPTCQIVRPPRASHCRDCDNCVMRFDHHCPFVCNCVGQRNYAFFTGFLVSVGCLGFAVIAGAGIYMAHSGTDPGRLGLNSFALDVLLVVIGLPTAALLLGVTGLGLFHVFLSCRGRTTKEVLTGKVNIGGRTLLTLRGRSLLRARDRVREQFVV